MSIRIIGLPGEEPLPQDVIDGPKATVLEETAAVLMPAEVQPLVRGIVKQNVLP